MISLENNFTAENICTIESVTDFLYFGSYVYRNEERTGTIYIYRDDIPYGEIQTSGTFKLLSYGKKLVAINAYDISIFEENQMENILRTENINTTGLVHQNILYFANITGEIFSYSLTENRILKKEKGEGEAVWSLYFFNSLLFGDDSNTFLLEGKAYPVDSTVTSILCYMDSLYILTYLSLYKYENGLSQIDNVSGGWQLNIFLDQLVILDDTGMRMYSSDFKLQDAYGTKSNAYGYYNLNNRSVYLSSFYENKVFKLSINRI